MPRPVTPIRIELTPDERSELERIGRAQALAHREVLRAKIVLMLADGRSISSIARDLGQQRRIVCKWGKRFLEKRLRGLDDLPGRGRAASFSPCGGAIFDQDRVRAA
jgi:Winged helix-turn helix